MARNVHRTISIWYGMVWYAGASPSWRCLDHTSLFFAPAVPLRGPAPFKFQHFLAIRVHCNCLDFCYVRVLKLCDIKGSRILPEEIIYPIDKFSLHPGSFWMEEKCPSSTLFTTTRNWCSRSAFWCISQECALL